MLKPLNNILIVKLISFKKSKVDIETREEDLEKNLVLGEVVGISEESKFKIGDNLIFGKYSYETFKFEGVEYYFVREEDVIAIKQ